MITTPPTWSLVLASGVLGWLGEREGYQRKNARHSQLLASPRPLSELYVFAVSGGIGYHQADIVVDMFFCLFVFQFRET